MTRYNRRPIFESLRELTTINPEIHVTSLARFEFSASKKPVAINPAYVVKVETVFGDQTGSQTQIFIAGDKPIQVLGSFDETVTTLDSAMAQSPPLLRKDSPS